MFLTLEEVIRWVGFTLLEIWLHLFCIFIFTILLVLRVEQATETSWWNIFIPLFFADGFSAYFRLIVFIRTLKTGNIQAACLRAFLPSLILICLFLCELLFCLKLSETMSISYSEVFTTIFIGLLFLIFRVGQTRRMIDT